LEVAQPPYAGPYQINDADPFRRIVSSFVQAEWVRLYNQQQPYGFELTSKSDQPVMMLTHKIPLSSAGDHCHQVVLQMVNDLFSEYMRRRVDEGATDSCIPEVHVMQTDGEWWFWLKNRCYFPAAVVRDNAAVAAAVAAHSWE